MVYKVIGLMSGSSLDGLDIAYVHLQEGASTIKDSPRRWEFSILNSVCYPYSEEWQRKLASARDLSAGEYLLLHAAYGRYLGEQVLRFIEENNLHYQVQLIASHGHTTFHAPEQFMTAQLGDGAAIAAVTKINVVSDLRAMDVALGGQGAPIVPVGEKLLLQDYACFLNLGGIANISAGGSGVRVGGNGPGTGVNRKGRIAFDVCPANRVLNGLAVLAGKAYDEGGGLAARGKVEEGLLRQLNELAYYGKPYPKSLANEFGTEVVLPMMVAAIEGMEGEGVDQNAEGGISVEDGLRTYVEHIAVQVRRAVERVSGGEDGGEVQWTVEGGRDSGEARRAMEGAGGQGAGTGGHGEHDKGVGTDEGRTKSGTDEGRSEASKPARMLVTGGGAHNTFLVSRLRELLTPLGVEVVVPDGQLVDYKEALVMALIGVLRWREENNVFASVTGAARDSIGGAVWIGQEA